MGADAYLTYLSLEHVAAFQHEVYQPICVLLQCPASEFRLHALQPVGLGILRNAAYRNLHYNGLLIKAQQHAELRFGQQRISIGIWHFYIQGLVRSRCIEMSLKMQVPLQDRHVCPSVELHYLTVCDMVHCMSGISDGYGYGGS